MKAIFQRYYEKTATPEETVVLMQWMADPANKAELLTLMREAWEGLPAGEQIIAAAQSDAMLESILQAHAAPVVRTGKTFRLWRGVAAAAVIALLLCGAMYVWMHHPPAAGIAVVNQGPLTNDVLPGGNRAVLTLANGSAIVLDRAGRGLLAQEGATAVRQTQDGQLQYKAGEESNGSIGFNTVATPRGGQYQVVLPDGSKVWLNAASSLRFPTAFTGNERNVELTGEAYFEIAKNKDKPFHVLVNGMQVEVLGTHFNVMAYDDEGVIKTSLLEGRVKVSHGGGLVFLLPSQQASLRRDNNQLLVDKNADVDKAVAWKNGLFDFEDDDIQSIMRQLARWYNVKLVYEGTAADQRYTGYIRREVPVSQVLHMLELVGGVSFTISNNTITVKTKP